jgi:hypothetical protein
MANDTTTPSPANMIHAASPKIEQKTDTLYAAEYLGSGTFRIVKPKRQSQKRRQSALKGTVRGARK